MTFSDSFIFLLDLPLLIFTSQGLGISSFRVGALEITRHTILPFSNRSEKENLSRVPREALRVPIRKHEERQAFSAFPCKVSSFPKLSHFLRRLRCSANCLSPLRALRRLRRTSWRISPHPFRQLSMSSFLSFAVLRDQAFSLSPIEPLVGKLGPPEIHVLVIQFYEISLLLQAYETSTFLMGFRNSSGSM